MAEAKTRYHGRKSYISPTQVNYGATIGAGAMILAGVSIGRFATVGLGAVVVRSVLDYALVVGNPARQIGWVCECGIPLKKSKKNSALQCVGCRKKYKEQNGRLKRSHG